MRIGLSRYRGSTWCYRPELDSLLSIHHPRLVAISRKQGQAPPWTRQRPKTFGIHLFPIIEIRHERCDRRWRAPGGLGNSVEMKIIGPGGISMEWLLAARSN